MLLLPVVHVRDCRRPVAKDPGLDVHGSGFGVSYCHIYYPLQAFTLVTCGGKREKSGRGQKALKNALKKG